MSIKVYRRAAQRLRVVVVTPGGRGGIDRMMDAIRQDLREHPRVDIDVQFMVSRGANIYLSPIVLAWALLRIIYMRMRHRIDIIHINLSSNASTYRKLFVAAVASALCVPYIVQLHSGSFAHFWASCSGFTRRRIEILFRQAKAIVVLGRIWSDLVVTNLPELADRVIILRNSTKRGRPHYSSDGSIKILFLGRLGRAKGIPVLLDAFNRLGHLKNWRATLAGDGEVKETCLAVERLGLAERVQVLGWLEDDRVSALLEEADILVLPSLFENLPMCVVEAFAHGLAVVCTPVGALPEIVEHERTGLLVPPENAPALASALERLITDPALRARLGVRARAQHALHFEIGGYVDRLIDVWRRASL